MTPNLIKKNENTTVQGLHSRILINLLFSCALKAYPPGNKGRSLLTKNATICAAMFAVLKAMK